MSSIIPFSFESSEIRLLNSGNGEPLFVAKDVAIALGYSNPQDAVRNSCKKAKSLKDIGCAQGSPLTNQYLTLDPQTKLIPESDVYRLVMKSTLPSAERFQDWVMDIVLPSIRKTGAFSVSTSANSIDLIERRLNAELAVFRTASAELRMSDASKVRGLSDICRAYGGDPTHFLPAYVGDPFARCITDLLKEHQSNLTDQVANLALINLGLLENKERRGKGGTKVSFKCLTQAGLEYGRNETSVQQPRQTQPLYYPDKFAELLGKVESHITHVVRLPTRNALLTQAA